MRYVSLSLWCDSCEDGALLKFSPVLEECLWFSEAQFQVFQEAPLNDLAGSLNRQDRQVPGCSAWSTGLHGACLPWRTKCAPRRRRVLASDGPFGSEGNKTWVTCDSLVKMLQDRDQSIMDIFKLLTLVRI
ncbi:unnamed protein product [Durusdinium trenchii]|uniref:Uncharacterized protein n=1 Tax=Durusdinium trenchii TaxID=1381693 RepID=A0ABP0SS53_9DINO